MRDWLTIQTVFGVLLVTSFTCVGLLALWAATSRWHWFLRVVIILGVLAPLLLRPMYEPFVTFAAQIVVTMSALRIYEQREVLWEVVRRRRNILLPRFSMQFVLAFTCLAAVATAIAVAATKQLGSTFWIAPASLGVVAGLATLLATWLARVGWSWKNFLIILIALAALSYAYQQTDYFEQLAPTVNFWPHSWPPSSILPVVVSHLRALAQITSAVALQYALLLAWHRWLSPEKNSGHSFRAARRLLIVAALLLFAVFPVYMVAILQFPCAIPEEASFPGDDARFQELLALSGRFKGTPLWGELCANQLDKQRIAKAVTRQANEFDELHRILEQPLWRPVTVDWIVGRSTYPGSAGWRKAMDENSQLSTLAQVLAAGSDAAQVADDTAAAIERALDLLRIGESTSRATDFSTHLRADTFAEMAMARIYRVLPFLNESQCEAVIQRLIEMENRREPIAKLLNYHRAQPENEIGWMGHFTVALGDIANQLDASLDVNHTQFLPDLDRRGQALARLLIIELLLRQHFLRTSEYPEELGSLGVSMGEWFADPFALDSEKFIYRLRDGGYLLYSVGVDRDDDGGRPPGRKEYGGIDWRGDGDLRLDAHFDADISD